MPEQGRAAGVSIALIFALPFPNQLSLRNPQCLVSVIMENDLGSES